MRASEDLAWSSAVAPIRRTTSADFTAGGARRDGHRSALAFCDVGQVSAGCTAAFILEESDDDSTYTALATSATIAPASAPWNGILEARPTKAWVRVTLRVSGADTSHTVTASAVLVLGDGNTRPEVNYNVEAV